MSELWQKIWYGQLKRPFSLNVAIDQGDGQVVVMLHGLGRNSDVWKGTAAGLVPLGYRAVALDLLGFGQSPKPQWLDYTVDDHARAVIACLERLKLSERAIIVGHSMGCLIAVRIARLRPDLVKHLVLYQMPLHDGLPETRRYKFLNEFYFKLYQRIMALEPNFSQENMRLAERLARRAIGMEITEETWLPLIRSLENTIMKQTTGADIQTLDTPMDVIWGSFDMLVIRGKPQHIFGESAVQVATHKVPARHTISDRASHLIIERITASAVIG